MNDFFSPKLPVTNQQLVELRNHWTTERRSYPGWAITPYENRERVWNHTRYWIPTIIHMSAALPAPEDILLIFELNWRLERCMMPLFLEWVEKFSAVVERYQPIAPSDGTRGLISPNVARYSQLPWTELTEAWLNLVFALAREAREDQDSSRFEKWMALAEPSRTQRSEWGARWHQEQCLFGLMRLDRAQVEKFMELWPRFPDEPFWEARRAAILAEIGSFSEAEQIAESALERIRLRLRPFANDFSALSQEAWVMLLLDAVKQAKDMARMWPKRGPFISRWEQLKVYGIDPWQELNFLELALKGPTPEDLPALRVRRGFDPGREHRTRHYVSEPAAWKALPAFALLRLFEEAAIPLTLGTLSIHSEATTRAARWASPYAPLWSLSSIVRIGKEEEFKEMFSRPLVNALTEQHVQSLYGLIKPPLEAALAKSWTNWQEARSNFNYRLIKPNVELLSRLFFRLPEELREEVFALACRMYQSEVFRSDFTLHDPLRELFERVIYGMSDGEVRAHLESLLALPLAAPNSEPFEARRWVEPTVFVRPRDRKGDMGPQPIPTTDTLSRLQNIVRTGSPEERWRAVFRVSALDSFGLLDAEQAKVFAEGLWSRVDAKKGLPADTYMTDYSFLHMPQPSEGMAKKALASHLLNRVIPAVATIADDGRLQYSMPIGTEAVRFTQDVVRATVPLSPRNANQFIDWAPEQALRFLEMLSDWWQRSKTVFEKISKRDELYAEVTAVFEEMLEIFAHVILPRLPKATHPVAAGQALTILGEMEQSGVPLLGISPMLLFAEPDLFEKISSDIQNGLVAKGEDTSRRAIFAVQSWALLSVRSKPPHEVPSELVELLTDKVFFRTPPALPSALAAVGDMIDHLPELFGRELIEKLLQALKHLELETEIPTTQTAPFEATDEYAIDVEERPSVRRYATFLASQLFHLSDRSHGRPAASPVLKAWEEIGHKDLLPEVRHAWNRQTY
jgi:hypothetical protein